MEKFEIITLKPDEWAQYKQLRLRALKEEPSAFGSSYEQNLKNSDEYWKERLSDPKCFYLFVKYNNNLIGMGGYALQDDYAHILAVYMSPEYRGKGLSKNLLSKILDLVQENKSIKKVELQVNAENESAVKLYKSVNFEIKETRKLKLGDGLEHDCYHMERNL